MELIERNIESSDGVTIHVRECLPKPIQTSNAHPIATFVWVHGLGEHGGRYLHLAEEMVERGWRVILLDLRGHGLSTGFRTHVLSFDEFIHDLKVVWEHFGLGKGQAVLAAHSMGGLVSLRAIQSGSIHPAAVVLTAPLLKLKVRVNRLKKLFGKVVVRYFPRIRFRNGLDPQNMTRDVYFARLREADPLIVRTVTAGWFFSMERALRDVHRDAKAVAVPLLAVQGAEDVTTDGDAIEGWLRQTSVPKSRFLELPDHLHDLMHETDWKSTLDKVIGWIHSIRA